MIEDHNRWYVVDGPMFNQPPKSVVAAFRQAILAAVIIKLFFEDRQSLFNIGVHEHRCVPLATPGWQIPFQSGQYDQARKLLAGDSYRLNVIRITALSIGMVGDSNDLAAVGLGFKQNFVEGNLPSENDV